MGYKAGGIYGGPIWVIGGDDLVFRQPEDAFLEDELGIGGSHCEWRCLLLGGSGDDLVLGRFIGRSSARLSHSNHHVRQAGESSLE